MYFPYFRGRQYELLALRELAENNLLSKKVKPIVEPVKFSSTFFKTIKCFLKKNYDLGIVCNPTVGDFKRGFKIQNGMEQNEFIEAIKEGDILKTFIINDDVQDYISACEKSLFMSRSNFIVILKTPDDIKKYKEIYKEESAKYILLPLATRRGVYGDKVLFENKFNKKTKNADYITCTNEFFSDDHLYYQDEGYCGVADYSIIGDEYIETGFAPYAVAIHIVYMDENNALRINHFVSKTNSDYNDTAGKYYEALEELHSWYNSHEFDVKNETSSLRTFLSHYQQQTYPGLGTVKKLSIMHHLELMGKFLEGEM